MKINLRLLLFKANCLLPDKELTVIYLVPTSTVKNLPVKIVMHCTHTIVSCVQDGYSNVATLDFYPDSSLHLFRK